MAHTSCPDCLHLGKLYSYEALVARGLIEDLGLDYPVAYFVCADCGAVETTEAMVRSKRWPHIPVKPSKKQRDAAERRANQADQAALFDAQGVEG